MASTNQLIRTINYAQQFVRNAPLIFSGTNDPAFFNADWVRQFILSPPFAWRWNRGVTTINLVQGTQDYVVHLPTFGWLEKGALINSTTPAQTFPLTISTELAFDVIQQVPTHFSAQSDDGNGNISFRFLPVPDQSYTATIDFQGQSPSFQTTGDFWTPIPDYLSYLYNQGFLAKTYEYLNDQRFAEAATIFMRQLVAVNEGLTDTQKNLFLNGKLETMREFIETQAGRQGKNIL